MKLFHLHQSAQMLPPEQRKKRRKAIRLRWMIACIFIVLAGVSLFFAQVGFIRSDETKMLENYFSQLPEFLDDISDLADSYDSNHCLAEQNKLSALYQVMARAYSLENLTWDERIENADNFRGLCDLSGVNGLILCDLDGNIYLSSNQEDLDKNLVSDGYISQDDWQTLLGPDNQGTVVQLRADGAISADNSPLMIEKDGVFYEYHSAAVSLPSQAQTMLLVSVMDSTVSYTNYNQLKDISFLAELLNDYKTISLTINNSRTEQPGQGEPDFVLDYDSDTLGQLRIEARIHSVDLGEIMPMVWTFIALALVIALIVLYSIFLMNSGREKMRARLLPFAVFGLIAVLAVSMYSQTLIDISDQMSKAQYNTQTIERIMQENSELNTRTEASYKNNEVYLAKILAALVEDYEDEILNVDNPYKAYYYQGRDEDGSMAVKTDSFGNPVYALASSGILNELTESNMLDSMMILNSNGQCIASSSDSWYYILDEEEEGAAEGMYKTLLRQQPYYYALNQKKYIETIAVPVRLFPYDTKEGVTRYHSYDEYWDMMQKSSEEWNMDVEYGLLVISTSVQFEFIVSQQGRMAALLYALCACQDGHIYVHDMKTGSYSADTCPFTEEIDRLYNEGYYKAGEISFESYNNDTYLVCPYLTEDGKYMVITLDEYGQVYSYRNNMLLANAIIGLITLGLLCLILILISPREESHFADRGRNRIIPGRTIRFDERQPDEKIGVVWKWCLLGMLLLVALRVGYSLLGFNESPVLSYILQGEWPRSLNIFSVSAVLFIVVFTLLATRLVKRFIELISSSLNYRYDTVAKLGNSVVQYGAWLGVVISCAGMLGFNTGTVITSAGIMTVVVGLGANSIINDILSGMFQIFEGVYKVGDIITIDGFTGTVINMGLRTTKVLDHGRVKTFNNSKISGVINLTQQLASVVQDLSFELSVPQENAQQIIREHYLPLVEKTEYIVGQIQVNGLQNFNSKSYTIRLTARCLEADRQTVEQVMRQAQISLYRQGLILPADGK